jgi:hypothetical protein
MIHWVVYKCRYKIHLAFTRINPIVYLYRLPIFKEHFRKKGIDPIEEANEAFRRPDIGLSSMFAGGVMLSLVFMICHGIVNLYSAMFQVELHLQVYHFVAYGVISNIVNYYLLFKHDKYLAYFAEFEKMEKAEKMRWAWICIGVVFLILLFTIGSLVYMNYKLKYHRALMPPHIR